MRKEFQLTTEQYKGLLEAGKPVPALALQCGTPPSPQTSANAWWEKLGVELGFDYMTARPSSKGPRFFTAEVIEGGGQGSEERRDMAFDYCPSCGGDLDTGWECNKCGRDWRPWATLNLNVAETETEQ